MFKRMVLALVAVLVLSAVSVLGGVSARQSTPPTAAGGARWGVMMVFDSDWGYDWEIVIPRDWQNPDEATAAYRLDLSRERITLETCDYSGGYQLIRLQLNALVTLTDLASGAVVASEVFQGQMPNECPEVVNFTEGQTTMNSEGAPTSMSPVSEWIKAVLPEENRFQYTPTPVAAAVPDADALTLALTPVAHNADWTPYTQTIGEVEMVLVPAGCFTMGSDDDPLDDNAAHQVCFEQPFWLDRTEVTNAQFRDFHGQAEWKGAWVGPVLPRENVTWTEAAAFCEMRGARLPTEAEWEYAGRGPDSLLYPWGNVFLVENTVIQSNSNRHTAPVGGKLGGVSWVGAVDMIGNVSEWVNDWYEPYDTAAQVNPTGPATSNPDWGENKVRRGGSWNSDPAWDISLSIRSRIPPFWADDDAGFRCARTVDG